MFFISQDGEVKPWLETEEFKEVCKIFNTAYKKGVIHPDILTYPHEKVSQHVEQGKDLLVDLFALEQIRKNVPEYDIVLHTFAPEKPLSAAEFPIMNANAVSSTSPNPEAGVIFLNWLYSAQENSDLLNYGIEGEHWVDLGNRRYEQITDDDGVAKYSFGDWEMAHKDLVRLPKDAPDELEPIMFEMDENAEISIAVGFKFDTEPVAAEYAACMAELQASIYPLKFGVVSYEEGYDSAIKAMKAAGYDKLVEEFRRQFEEWLASK